MLSWHNGYFYIGQTHNFEKRKTSHFSNLRGHRHDNDRTQKVFNKYGEPKFIILELCDQSALNEREQWWLDVFFGQAMCCNLTPCATGTRGYKASIETCRKISAIRTGKQLSQEHKNSIGIGLLNAYKNGRPKPDLNGEKNPFYNKKHCEQALKKMRGHSRAVGGKNIKARLVLNLQTGIFYDCARDAARSIGRVDDYLYKFLTGYRVNRTPFIYA